MFKLIIVSNLKLCRGEFLQRVKKLCEAGIWGFVLREKDLSASEYKRLLIQTKQICNDYDVKFFAHSFVDIAIECNCKNIQFPLQTLSLNQDKLYKFDCIAASVHSIDEVKLALKFGANMLIAGHIFKTDCKKDLAPKGIKILEDIKEVSPCDIFAIGGIDSANFKKALEAGASGICVMSGAMNCADEARFVKEFL